MTEREELGMFPKLLVKMSGWGVAPPVATEKKERCSWSGEEICLLSDALSLSAFGASN